MHRLPDQSMRSAKLQVNLTGLEDVISMRVGARWR